MVQSDWRVGGVARQSALHRRRPRILTRAHSHLRAPQQPAEAHRLLVLHVAAGRGSAGARRSAAAGVCCGMVRGRPAPCVQVAQAGAPPPSCSVSATQPDASCDAVSLQSMYTGELCIASAPA